MNERQKQIEEIRQRIHSQIFYGDGAGDAVRIAVDGITDMLLVLAGALPDASALFQVEGTGATVIDVSRLEVPTCECEAKVDVSPLQHVSAATDTRLTEVERLRAAGDSLALEVKVMAASLFGKEQSWRAAKAPWWQDLVVKVDDWEAARAAAGGEYDTDPV